MGLWSKPPPAGPPHPAAARPRPVARNNLPLGHGATGKTLSALQKTAAHTEEDPPPPGPRQAQTRRKAWHPLPPQTPRPPGRPGATSTENASRNGKPDADRALRPSCPQGTSSGAGSPRIAAPIALPKGGPSRAPKPGAKPPGRQAVTDRRPPVQARPAMAAQALAVAIPDMGQGHHAAPQRAGSSARTPALGPPPSESTDGRASGCRGNRHHVKTSSLLRRDDHRPFFSAILCARRVPFALRSRSVWHASATSCADIVALSKPHGPSGPVPNARSRTETHHEAVSGRWCARCKAPPA
jgi:hypothetical protein